MKGIDLFIVKSAGKTLPERTIVAKHLANGLGGATACNT